jgi:thiol-disulfide isomerase/thioredoxin
MKVIKIGAVWCSGCLVMKPRWQEIEKENSWLKTEYLDADKDEEEVEQYDPTDYPCFVFLNKEGEEIDRLYGEISKDKIEAKINEHKGK